MALGSRHYHAHVRDYFPPPDLATGWGCDLPVPLTGSPAVPVAVVSSRPLAGHWPADLAEGTGCLLDGKKSPNRGDPPAGCAAQRPCGGAEQEHPSNKRARGNAVPHGDRQAASVALEESDAGEAAEAAEGPSALPSAPPGQGAKSLPFLEVHVTVPLDHPCGLSGVNGATGNCSDSSDDDDGPMGAAFLLSSGPMQRDKHLGLWLRDVLRTRPDLRAEIQVGRRA